MVWLVIAVIAALVVVMAVVAVRAVRVVPQNHAMVVERLGRFRKVAGAGLNVRIPMLDQVRAFVDLREQVVVFPPTAMVTADDDTVSITLKLFFKIVDVKASVYNSSLWIMAFEQLALSRLTDAIGDLTREESLRSRRAILEMLRASMDAEADRWGILINSVELTVDPA